MMMPDSEKSPVVPAGTYGKEGDVVLVGASVRAQTAKGEKTGLHFLSLGAQINDPEMGALIANTAPYGKYNTVLDGPSGSIAGQLIANLGLEPEKFEWDDDEDEKGNFAILGESLIGKKVVVQVGVDRTNRNVIENIWAF